MAARTPLARPGGCVETLRRLTATQRAAPTATPCPEVALVALLTADRRAARDYVGRQLRDLADASPELEVLRETIASSTQRATERLSTSRCIRSSVFSCAAEPTCPVRSRSTHRYPPQRGLGASVAQPTCPALTPSSRVTGAIGLPVSTTSRTAHCLKSWSKSGNSSSLSPSSPQRRCLHATRGSADGIAGFDR